MEKVIETFVNKILDLLVKALERGVPEIGIPPLDPIKIEKKIDIPPIKSMAINLAGNFRDFEVSGLAKMGVPKLGLEEKKVKATSSTSLEVKGKYTLNGRAVKVVTIDADSTFSMKIETLSVTIGINYEDRENLKAIVELKSEGLKLELKDFVRSKIANSAINSALNKISPTIAKFVEETLGPALQNAVQKLIDQHKSEIAS